MKLSPEVEQELFAFACSDDFRRDMDFLKTRWQRPFLRDRLVDTDSYIEFVTQFNEFISHKPKAFRPMIEKDMKL